MEGVNEFYIGCLNFFPIPLPKANPLPKNEINFSNIFKKYCHLELTSKFFESLTESRKLFIRSFEDHNTSYQSRLSLVQSYLNNILILWASIKEKGQVEPDKELLFEWRLYINGQGEYYKSNEILFEIIFVYHLLALCHYYVGKKLLETDINDNNLNEASKNFLQASSLMFYVDKKLDIKEWSRRFNTKNLSSKQYYLNNNPPECTLGVAQGLAFYYQSCAQVCATIKSIRNSSASSSLVKARLAVGVVNLLLHSLNSFKASCPFNIKFLPHWFNQTYFNHINAQKELFFSIIYYYLSIDAFDKKEVGLCLGYCEESLNHLVEQKHSYNEKSNGLPPVKETLTSLVPKVKPFLVKKINEIKESADRDNRFIYFQNIVKSKDFPAPPTEAIIMKPSVYIEPTINPIVLEEPVKTSFFSKLFRSKTKKTDKDGKEIKEEDKVEEKVTTNVNEEEIPPVVISYQPQFNTTTPPPTNNPPSSFTPIPIPAEFAQSYSKTLTENSQIFNSNFNANVITNNHDPNTSNGSNSQPNNSIVYYNYQQIPYNPNESTSSPTSTSQNFSYPEL